MSLLSCSAPGAPKAARDIRNRALPIVVTCAILAGTKTTHSRAPSRMSSPVLRTAVAVVLAACCGHDAWAQAQGLRLQRSIGTPPSGDELPAFVISDRLEGLRGVRVARDRQCRAAQGQHHALRRPHRLSRPLRGGRSHRQRAPAGGRRRDDRPAAAPAARTTPPASSIRRRSTSRRARSRTTRGRRRRAATPRRCASTARTATASATAGSPPAGRARTTGTSPPANSISTCSARSARRAAPACRSSA